MIRFSNVFYLNRQLGNTTSLITLLRQNDKAVLVVSDFCHADSLRKKNPDIYPTRIVCLGDLNYWLGRKDVFPIFDNNALHYLFKETSAKLQLLQDTTKTLKNLELENEL